MPRLPDVVAELRDHQAQHRSSEEEEGCWWCELWLIYTRGSRADLDALIERFELRAPGDELLEMARVIRSEWGEGDWTNP